MKPQFGSHIEGEHYIPIIKQEMMNSSYDLIRGTNKMFHEIGNERDISYTS